MTDLEWKKELIQFAKRYDVIFSFGGMLIGSMIVYADKMPLWALMCIVAVRETFGFMGMLSKSKEGE